MSYAAAYLHGHFVGLRSCSAWEVSTALKPAEPVQPQAAFLFWNGCLLLPCQCMLLFLGAWDFETFRNSNKFCIDASYLLRKVEEQLISEVSVCAVKFSS